MTEERATYDAGTPGPIDPRDGASLRAVMWQTANSHARDIESFINDWEGSPPEAELHLLQLIADEAAATAVARAVLPPGYVAVKETELQLVTDWALSYLNADDIDSQNHAYLIAIQLNRSLLPTETEATR